jgi:hypothetical protein
VHKYTAALRSRLQTLLVIVGSIQVVGELSATRKLTEGQMGMFQLTARFLSLNQSVVLNSFILRIQHNLAEHLALFHVLVGSANILQRKYTIYHRSQPSGEDVRQHFV